MAEGSFDFLFNICLPADHPINSFNGVPYGFKHVVLTQSETSGITDTGSVVSSATLKQERVTTKEGLQENVFVFSVFFNYVYRLTTLCRQVCTELQIYIILSGSCLRRTSSRCFSARCSRHIKIPRIRAEARPELVSIC